MTNVYTNASQHNVIRRLAVLLIPRGTIAVLTGPYQLLQVMADTDMVPIQTLIRGRPVDSSRISFGLLNGWIKACEQSHGLVCAPVRQKSVLDYTFRLIDTEHRCVVVAPSGSEYIALSYTWGDPRKFRHLKLTEETSDWLHKPGALDDNNPQIPTTIKDTLAVAIELGVRYLWVDAICIQQDDEGDKLSQLPNMNKIYGAAKVTIVAGAGSDAWAGLLGVGSDPKPRECRQSLKCIGGLSLVTVLEPYHRWRNNSAGDHRGWTFQEKVLSKRLLIFGTEQVYFQCKTDLWSEDTICENFDPNIYLELLENDNLLGGSPFTQYEIMVMSYTNRCFGFEDDILNAFRGLENLLSPSLTVEFFWGLPVSMFDLALTWVFTYHYPGRRRENFPSWSWAGWNYSGISGAYGIKFPHQKTVGREVLWHKLSMESPPKPKVMDSTQPTFLFTGFQFSILGDLTYTAPSVQESAIAGHLIPHTTDSPVSHVLCFWTSTAILTVSRSESTEKRRDVAPIYADSGKAQNNILVSIYNKASKEIGPISLDRDWRSAKPDILEFIVIARYCPFSTDRVFNGYYVLLIEWIGEVAYRVQAPINSIVKEDWLAAEPQWKLITLA